MWFLPNSMETLRLPEAVMFLPSHYGAADRDALSALLRTMAPELPLVYLEARAVQGSRLKWAGAICVVHGVTDDLDDEALRSLAAGLDAQHCLVQRPVPRLTGTAWMEPTLKVPLLRALERAWRDPAHPLQAVRVRDLPVRELAQYTDDPTEFMALVRETLEHRLRHAAVGVSRDDWERSVDRALALRLRQRIPEALPESAARYVLGAAKEPHPGAPDVAIAERAGLGFDQGGRWRAAPIVSAVERPLVARLMMAGSSERSVSIARASDFCHMVRETWILMPHLPPTAPPEAVARSLGVSADYLRTQLPRDSHLWLELPDSAEMEIVRDLLRGISAEGDRARPTLRAFALYLRGITCTGPDAQAQLQELLNGLIALRHRVSWSEGLLSSLRLLLLLQLVSRRRERRDIAAIGALTRSLVGSAGTYGDDLRALVDALPLSSIRDPNSFGVDHRSDHNVTSWGLHPKHIARLARLSRGSLSPPVPSGLPRHAIFGVTRPEHVHLQEELKEAWPLIVSGDPAQALRLLPSLSSTTEWTLVHLHAALARAVASLLVGDLDAAFTLANSVLDCAAKYDIALPRAFAREVLAGFHEQRGESEEAATLLLRARARYRALGDTSRVRGVQRRLSRLGVRGPTR